MVPAFEEFILPTLKLLSDGETRTLTQVIKDVTEYFHFSEDDMKEKTRSGRNTKVVDRITWALTYLCQAGLAKRPVRASVAITYTGLDLLENPPKIITRDFLYAKYPSFKAFHDRKKGEKHSEPSNSEQFAKQPSEEKKDSLAQDLEQLRNAIASLVNLGIEPTEEMYQKERELIAEISSKNLFPAVAKVIADNPLAERFILLVKYDKGMVYLKYDATEDNLANFPADAVLYEEYKETITPKKKRRPNLNFHQMGLIEGDKLTYVADESIQVTVVSENRVEYKGREYSLTRLTQELKGLDHAIQPTGEWVFDGQNLLDIYNDTYKEV